MFSCCIVSHALARTLAHFAIWEWKNKLPFLSYLWNFHELDLIIYTSIFFSFSWNIFSFKNEQNLSSVEKNVYRCAASHVLGSSSLWMNPISMFSLLNMWSRRIVLLDMTWDQSIIVAFFTACYFFHGKMQNGRRCQGIRMQRRILRIKAEMTYSDCSNSCGVNEMSTHFVPK